MKAEGEHPARTVEPNNSTGMCGEDDASRDALRAAVPVDIAAKRALLRDWVRLNITQMKLQAKAASRLN